MQRSPALKISLKAQDVWHLHCRMLSGASSWGWCFVTTWFAFSGLSNAIQTQPQLPSNVPDCRKALGSGCSFRLCAGGTQAAGQIIPCSSSLAPRQLSMPCRPYPSCWAAVRAQSKPTWHTRMLDLAFFKGTTCPSLQQHGASTLHSQHPAHPPHPTAAHCCSPRPHTLNTAFASFAALVGL